MRRAMDPLVGWMALAWHTPMSSAEQRRIALGPGPEVESFPEDILRKEFEDLVELRDLGVELLTVADPDYPEGLREEGPIVLQLAGSSGLLGAEGVRVLAGHKQLTEALDAGDRAVVVLSKGLLKARTLLRALHEPLEYGTVALVSAEPPRASWGPVRDLRRDELVRALEDLV